MSSLRRFFANNATTMRLAMGQSGLLITLLVVAAFLGLVPERTTAVIEGRAALAEAIATNSSIFITRADLRRMEANLRLVHERNPQILSAAIRNAEQKVLATVGEHETHWREQQNSNNTQLTVPIWEGEKRWGQVELRFEPLQPAGALAFIQQPVFVLIAFLASVSYVVFFFYLRKMLKDLDPSQAIPDRVRSALDTIAEGLLVLDAKQNIVLANEAFASLVKLAPGDLLGQNVSIFDWRDAAGHALNQQHYPWRAALTQCQTQKSQTLRLMLDGNHHCTFLSNCSPVLTDSNKAGGVLVSFDDITELEEKEQQLRQSKLQAEQANQAKSDFLANMSHEIRTPMNAIMGFTQVLKRAYNNRSSDTLQDDSLHYLNTIANSSKHLLDLINDILDLSKVEAGQIDVESIPCSLHAIIHDVIHILQVKAQQKAISLTFTPESDLPETIHSDPARLRQILTNLVGNAIKFTDQGGVKIVTRLSADKAPSTITIEVVDSGIGMTEQQASSVFSPFVQADSSITRRFGGTGLGLSISKRFAEALGGSLTVSSELGLGSTFSVTVPIGDISGVVMLTPQQLLVHSTDQGERAQGHWLFAPAKVLVVDDGAENRELLQVVLSELGLQVSTAGNGQQGLDSLDNDIADLVLMDVQMPVMDGYTAVAKIRERGWTMPVIALTAHAMKGIEQRCLKAGYSGYMSKPINIESLTQQLADYLGAQWLQDDDIADGQVSADTTSVGAEQAATTIPQPATTTPQPEEGVSTTTLQSPTEPAPRAHIDPATLTPIVSSLPIDKPKFRAVVCKFVERLQQQLVEIDNALAQRQFAKLKDFGHWLKGSGGSVGFAVFNQPGLALETLAKQRDYAGLVDVVAGIKELAQRVEAGLPHEARVTQEVLSAASDDQSSRSKMPETVSSSLMNSPKLRPIIEAFVTRLAARLDELDAVVDQHNFSEVADLAHWLKGSAGTAGFDGFTPLACELEQCAKAQQLEKIRSTVASIRDMFERIALNSTQKPPGQEGVVVQPRVL